jgi:hypothetical protein
MEALREHATREGYEVFEEIVDPGQSGASLERPGLDRVRDLVAAGDVSVVLAQDRDRFAREPAYHYLLKGEFGEHGCKLRALNDRGDDSPEGELTDGILDQLAKFERAKTAERSRRGKLRKAREGKIIANNSVDYGFKYNETRDGYEVDERLCRWCGVFFVWLAWKATPCIRSSGHSTLRNSRLPPARGTGPRRSSERLSEMMFIGRTVLKRSKCW